MGRQDEIHKLEKSISTAAGPRKLAITGLGGVGKTQIALELAYRMQDRDPECSIFWIPCTSYQAVEQACMAIAQMIGIPDVKPAEVKERIKAIFSQKDWKWLLIFDNADDMDMWIEDSTTSPPLKDFLPDNNQGHVVFTTRNRKLAVKLASSDVMHLRELDEKTGTEFLEKSLIQKGLLNDSHAVLALLEQLTFLPLAVAQAAAYMSENSISVSDYLLLLREQEADVVELLSEDFGDDGRYKDVQNPVAMTWLISFQQVQKLDQLACDYLALMACVAPRNIPESFLPRPASKKKMIDALGLLSSYSFITIQPGNSFISLHRLVHLATRNWMKKEEQFPRYIQYATDRLSENFPDNDEANRQLWREYLPHALALLDENEFQKQIEKYIDYIRKLGICLHSDGRYNEAEKLLVQVVKTRRQVLGSEHLDALISMNDLALNYIKQGRHKDGAELSMESFEIQERMLGLEYSDTLFSMDDFALPYSFQSVWKNFEESVLQAVKDEEQLLGLEHPCTLNSITSLATIYRAQQRWREAEELEMQVMESRRRVLGPEHPATLDNLINLALTYQDQGRFKEAEELAVHVIETQKRVLGPEHPETLDSMTHLANILKELGNIPEALSLLEICIDLLNKVLGSDHPLVKSASYTLKAWERDKISEEQAKQTSVETSQVLPMQIHPPQSEELGKESLLLSHGANGKHSLGFPENDDLRF